MACQLLLEVERDKLEAETGEVEDRCYEEVRRVYFSFTLAAG